MKHVLVIVNPTAGKVTSRKLRRLQRELDSRQLSHHMIYTSFETDAGETLGNAWKDNFTHILVVGGDGSLNDVINGMGPLDVPVGLLSLGTGNDYVKNFPSDGNLYNVLDNILNDRVTEVSVGLCNGRRFINGVGAGFDGQIVANMHRSPSWFSGHAAYYAHVVRILGGYRERRLTYVIDGEEFTRKILLILAGFGKVYGGGFKLLPRADIRADSMQICIIERVRPARRFAKLQTLKHGRHASMKEVSFHAGKRLYIGEADVEGQIDGELMGKPPFEITVDPRKLKFILP